MQDRNSWRIAGPLKAVMIVPLFIALVACARSTPATQISENHSSAEASAQSAAPAAADNTPETASPEFNASRAMQYVKEIVAFGPRPLGSEGHKKTENYILAHLKGDEVERDDFEIN